MIGVVLGFVAADLGFGIYDAVRAAQGSLPSRTVGIVQAVVASPQVVAFGAMHIVLSKGSEGDQGATAGVLFLPGLANSLFAHGIWASQSPALPAGVPLGVSAAVGFDTTMTASILTRAGQGHLSGTGMGVAQMVLTAPQIAASAYALAREPGNTAGWGLLTAWSGVIFTHGLVSTIVGGRSEAPPPPPPPPPVAPRPPLLVPGSLDVGPMPVTGGGGVALSGRWL